MAECKRVKMVCLKSGRCVNESEMHGVTARHETTSLLRLCPPGTAHGCEPLEIDSEHLDAHDTGSNQTVPKVIIGHTCVISCPLADGLRRCLRHSPWTLDDLSHLDRCAYWGRIISPTSSPSLCNSFLGSIGASVRLGQQEDAMVWCAMSQE